MPLDLVCLTSFQANKQILHLLFRRLALGGHRQLIPHAVPGPIPGPAGRRHDLFHIQHAGCRQRLADSRASSSTRRFFFLASARPAPPACKAGATMISRKILAISAAVSASTVPFVTTIPPKMDTGSASYAFWYAFAVVSANATPQGLACFTPTTAIFSVLSRNSRNSSSAPFVSLILL